MNDDNDYSYPNQVARAWKADADTFRTALEKIVGLDIKPELHAQHADECSICIAKEALTKRR